MVRDQKNPGLMHVVRKDLYERTGVAEKVGEAKVSLTYADNGEKIGEGELGDGNSI